MQSIRTILFTGLGFVIAGALVGFAASLGLALAGIAFVVMAGSWLATRIGLLPARAPVHARSRARRGEPRIWNDGRGTIIDL